MNSLKVFALFLSLASVTAAQKEVPLPKDLPPYAAEQPLRAPAVQSSKVNVGLTILSDILQNASFPDAEVALAKRNLADSLRERESQPSFLAARVMGKVLFGEHPYHVTAPTQESIAASTATDLRNTYALRVRPDQAVLVAVGDFDNDTMLGLAKTQFGGWKPPGGATLASTPRPTVLPQHAV